MHISYCPQCGVVNDLHINLYCRLMQSDRAELERLRGERRWIPVEERLPEEDVPVLCVDSRGEQMVAWSGWGEWCGPEIEAEITYWMPLPPLPGEEGRDE